MESLPRSYQTRFADSYYGVGLNNLKNIRNGYNQEILPPQDFGYENSTNLGSFYHTDKYMIFSSITTEYYPKINPKYEKFWRYNTQDFQKLASDNSVNYIYDNGVMRLLYINT